ncbi:unnamed protein product, partial [Ascophyllum nodosum]
MPLLKPVLEAASKHLSTLAPQGLKWTEKPTHAPSESASAQIAQPPPMYSVRSQSTAPKIISSK